MITASEFIWNASAHNNEENLRWAWLRAVEWGIWPAFLSGPVVPLLLPFFEWWKIILVVIILTVIWAFIRYRYVNIFMADLGVYFVLLKWITCPVATIYLIVQHNYILAIMAITWPAIAGLFSIFVGGTKIGVIQNMFMKKLGYSINSSNKITPDKITTLTAAVLDVSHQCGQEFKKLIGTEFGSKSDKAAYHYIQVQYEFLFFFVHLVMRNAFHTLGDKKRNKLQEVMGPILSDATTEAWMEDWPDDLKRKIKDEFFVNLDRAESEYARYKGLSPAPYESPKGTLLWELGKNIASLSGYKNNPEVVMQCVEIVAKHFKDIKEIENMVVAAGKEL